MAKNQAITLDELCQKATDYVNNNWGSASKPTGWSMGRITKIEINPGLQNGCPALQNYCDAFRRLDNFVDANKCTIFAWHGTPQLNNIASICHDGFSPAKRKRQYYGAGEYFGVVAEDSHNYSGNTDRLILAQIIRCKHVSTHQNCYVVNNPKDQSYTFTLPVLVITYGNSAPLTIPWIQAPKRPIPSPFKAVQPQASGHHCWHWTKDDGSLEPYDVSMSTVLERYYKHYLKGGSCLFTTNPITRYCDKASQQYIIDFKRMTQENQRTGFKRCIHRSSRTMPQWHWMEDGNVAVPFPKAINDSIEQSYRVFAKQRNYFNAIFITPSIFRKKDNTQQVYKIDFFQMIQTNQQTGYQRRLTREMPKSGVAATSSTTGDIQPSLASTKRSISANKPSNNHIFSNQVPLVKPMASSYKWFWRKDGGILEPYPNCLSDLIEHHYQVHMNGGPQSFRIPGITRICDNAIMSYTIDFGPPMIQTNEKSGYQRRLTRSQPLQPKPFIANISTTSSKVKPVTAVQPKASPWQWYWMKDGGIPEPYPASVSNLIEHHYQLYSNQGGPPSIEHLGITRMCDNVVQSYSISFITPMTQTNRNTLFVRQLKRAMATQPGGISHQSNTQLIKVDKVKPKQSPYKWQWMKDDGGMEEYPDSISDLIEHHYQLQGKGGPQLFETPAISRQCDRALQSYIIDFSMPFTQTNRKTGYTRQVRRMLPTQSISKVPAPIQRGMALSFCLKGIEPYVDSSNAKDKSCNEVSGIKENISKESGGDSTHDESDKEEDSGTCDATYLPNTEGRAVQSGTADINNDSTSSKGGRSDKIIIETASPTNSETSDMPSLTVETTTPQANSGSQEPHYADDVGDSRKSETLQATNSSSEIAKTWFSPVLELVAGVKSLFWGNIGDNVCVGKDCLDADTFLN